MLEVSQYKNIVTDGQVVSVHEVSVLASLEVDYYELFIELGVRHNADLVVVDYKNVALANLL